MRTRLTLAVYLLGVAAGSAVLVAQNSPPSDQPTFRSGVNYVRLDMYATSRSGDPIEDLRPDEVQVFENGVRQSLDSFRHVRVLPSTAPDARIEPNTVRDSLEMAVDGRARLFVIFLDTYHTQAEASRTIRVPLVRFLDRVLGPDDLVALATPEMAASDITFARKTLLISNVMQEEWWGRRGRLADDQDPKEHLYDACYADSDRRALAAEMKARRREKLTLDALEDLVRFLSGVRDERKAILTVTEGWVLFRENHRLAEPMNRFDVASPPFLVPPRRGPNERQTVTASMEIECNADRLALASVDHQQRLRDIGNEANRSNVTFYPVFARGLVAFDAPIGPDPPPSIPQDAANLRARHDSLRTLAADTDGTAILNTNDTTGALRQIADDMSSYYLLAYYSTNTQLDGRFRTISVRVDRPGIRVRSRRGYRGPTPEMMLEATRAEAVSASAQAVTSAMSAVAAAANPRAPFRLRTASWAGTDEESGTFWIVGELDFRTRRELAWTAGASADVTVVAADGRQVAQSTLPVQPAEGSFAIRVPDTGSLPAGEYAVRVRMRPDTDPAAALSDIARVVVPAQGSPLGEALLWRRGPTTGLQHVRTADPRFQRSERVRLELPTGAEDEASARMLDRAGNPLQVPVQLSERQDDSGAFRWIVIDATLAPLAPGDYAVEVTQGGTTAITAFRVVP